MKEPCPICGGDCEFAYHPDLQKLLWTCLDCGAREQPQEEIK